MTVKRFAFINSISASSSTSSMSVFIDVALSVMISLFPSTTVTSVSSRLHKTRSSLLDRFLHSSVFSCSILASISLTSSISVPLISATVLALALGARSIYRVGSFSCTSIFFPTLQTPTLSPQLLWSDYDVDHGIRSVTRP